MARNDLGKICGKTVAAKLSRYAAPVPSPISVNILGLRCTIDIQKRSINGQPPHNTTGVASKSSIQFRVAAGQCMGSQCAPIATTRIGTDSAALTQNLRHMDSYSGSASASASTSMGSSAIPQSGHEPGPI